MSKTVYTYAPEPVAEPPKVEKRPPVSYHAKAALIIGSFVAGGILIIGLAAGAPISPLWRWAIGFGATVAVLFGVPSTGITTIFEWWMAWVENHRRWQAEDEARYNAVAAPSAVEEIGITKPERLEMVCGKILRMHYYQGKEATRPECERARITQPEWNNANRLLQLIGLKGERGWQVSDSREAFDRFETYTRFDPDMIWYSPTGSTAGMIRFFAVNQETET